MEWFYAKQGEKEGPIDKALLQEMIQRAEVALSDLVWREGMEKWQPVREVLELAPNPGGGAMAPPPVPGSSAVGSPIGGAPAEPAPTATVPVPERDPGLPTIEAPPPTSALAVASMVCGMLALLACSSWALFGIPAVICGHMALKRIKTAEGPMEGRGMAVAGLATGYAGIVFQVLFIAFVVIGIITGGGKS